VSTLIEEACAAGARLQKACPVVGISPRTLQRWRDEEGVREDARAAAARERVPANRLSDAEREEILNVANQPEFAHLPPSQIVPALADQGRYIASESSFYRVLRDNAQLTPRGKSRPPSHQRPQPFEATAPNQLWSWDITYLATSIKGQFFYLYLILDVFSRKIVGWEIFESECAEQASRVFHKAHLREGIQGKDLVLHSDNGAPMKGATMLATLQRLGVVPSFSRPSVSNDNPYSEALFKTLKYRPQFPSMPFETLEAARQWVHGFVQWYNEEHRHSALKFVTPGQRHRAQDEEILLQRERLYADARKQQPARWSGRTRNWDRESTVLLNPGRPQKTEDQNTQKAA
jgi:transposase InsO family protein